MNPTFKTIIISLFCFFIFVILFLGSQYFKKEKSGPSEMYEDECYTTFYSLYQLCDNGVFDECIKSAEELNATYYPNDNVLNAILARAYYLSDNKEKSILYLERSLHGKYLCNPLKPSNELLQLEKAQIHFNLGILYGALGKKKKESHANNTAIEILKKTVGEKFNEKFLFKFKKDSELSLKHFSKIE